MNICRDCFKPIASEANIRCAGCNRQRRYIAALNRCPEGKQPCRRCFALLTPAAFLGDSGKPTSACARCRDATTRGKRRKDPIFRLMARVPAINPAPLRWVA